MGVGVQGQGGVHHPGVGEGVWEGSRGERGQGGRGQGTFYPPCHILHYHMVLYPEGTSHNYKIAVASHDLASSVFTF